MAKIKGYFDNAATTKVSEENLLLFNSINEEYWANPNAIHEEGLKAAKRYKEAEEEILNAMRLKDHKVIFTSGATEANNLAIRGVAYAYMNRGKHLITSSMEHPSVLEVFRELEKEGYEVTYLEPGEYGKIEADAVEAALRPDTILVSIMHINNEVGTVNEIEDIGDMLKAYPKIIFHTDAVQAIGKVKLNYSDVDLITISSHKIHGLKSGGALIKRKNIKLSPIVYGGGQQEGERSGTQDVAGACVLANAVKTAIATQSENALKVSLLRYHLVQYLESKPDEYHVNSQDMSEDPYIVNFALLKAKASVVVEALSREGFYVSTRSSCHASSCAPSHVVMAMYHDEWYASECIRVSFSGENTLEEVEEFIETLDKIVSEVYHG